MRRRVVPVVLALIVVVGAGGAALFLTWQASDPAIGDPTGGADGDEAAGMSRGAASARADESPAAEREGRRHVGAEGDVAPPDETAADPEGPVTRAQRLQWIREWMEIACGQGYAWKDRGKAQRALLEFDEKETVPIILEWATDPDPDARGWGWAMSILQALGPRAKSAVPAMARLLRRDEDRAWSAAFTLGTVGAAAVPALLEALHDDDPAIRAHALEGISVLRQPPRGVVDAVLGLVGSEDPELRLRAISALYRRGKAHSAAIVPVVATALSDPDERVRSQAVMLLYRFGTKSRAAVAALHDALRDDGEFVSVWAARTLGLIGPDARGETDTLVALLAESPDRWRTSIPGALAGLGPAALLAGVASESADVRALTIPLLPAAVESDSAVAAPAVAALRDALASDSGDVRLAAAEALGDLGPAAAAAVPSLLKLAEDGNGPVRRAALIAAARTGGARDLVLDVLLRELSDGPDIARAAAAEALGVLGGDAAPAVDALAAAVNDPDLVVRERAARALETVGPAAMTAAAALAGRLADDSERVRLAVAIALIAVDPPGLAARGAIAELRISDAISSRRGVVEGLGRHPSATWATVVVDRLDDRSPEVRIAAGRALAHFTEHASVVVPALVTRLGNERNLAVQIACANALEAFGKNAAEAIPVLERMAANERVPASIRRDWQDLVARLR